ncbi:serine/threonine protein kinase HipA of HipAB toxin-antitoxin module [Enterococcus rotai]|uniref:Uncharacterized protein n=1 Tax=Enterococcus rotai TaxID=118060 RepID=A0A0U2XC11_9ENTE|nr:hypothetical protein [Enterococcus rotai]ALS38487.1 hypothetical protein ATZ35_15440 [Enterococcus rotai]
MDLYTIKFGLDTKISMAYIMYVIENEEIPEMEQEFINQFTRRVFKKLLENKDKHAKNLNQGGEGEC